ncbi:hypothetical protein VTO42DRAFT_7200 [Malbranchea cinnamomea]
MLILIAGITGMVGQPCARAALARGHRVRGIGRNPNKLPAAIRDRLEGFVTSSGIYDRAALEEATAGVDAVVCAYSFEPEIVLEGQLLLLRAAERAGVKVWTSLEQDIATATLCTRGGITNKSVFANGSICVDLPRRFMESRLDPWLPRPARGV